VTQGLLPSVVVLGCGFSLPVCGFVISIPPRDTSAHQDSASTHPSGTPPPAQPPPTTGGSGLAP